MSAAKNTLVGVVRVKCLKVKRYYRCRLDFVFSWCRNGSRLNPHFEIGADITEKVDLASNYYVENVSVHIGRLLVGCGIGV